MTVPVGLRAFGTFCRAILLSNVWSPCHWREIGTLEKPREVYSAFENSEGSLDMYAAKCDGRKTIQRAKQFAIACHISAQREKLHEWLLRSSPLHVVMCRTMDDTNVCVQLSQQANGVDDEELPEFTEQTSKKGKMKVAPLLGMIQKLVVRRDKQIVAETVQLHTPSQILPKASQFASRCSKLTVQFLVICRTDICSFCAPRL